MLRTLALFAVCVVFNCVFASDDYKIVILSNGAVKGDKYWDGEFYEFYGIPYATAPKGRDKFQAPLPAEPWEGVLEASTKKTICQQCYLTGENEILVDGEEDCLLINLLVPRLANETNLVPVVVYIHSGAFSGGSSNMASFHYLARHDVIAISFNYRLGALGFACLGNKEIPGNAALKDQVAALRWINKNIKKFGGDPDKVTLAGFSVGATMAELLSLSKATTGLFNKLILDSGSALAPFAINRDPISTAKNIAITLGYNETITLEGLTEFYLNASIEKLAEKSVNYYLTNSTFGFAPCIENVFEEIEPILTDSPSALFKKGENNDIAVLTGFADMEGLSRSIKFGTWREEMNEDFSNFLPADLLFDDNKARDDFINKIKKYYFDNKPVNAEALQKYVDYFSDSMFKYNILKSAKLHASTSKRPVYLYEFSYTGKLNIEHNYMDRIKGASHRDQTAYVLGFFAYTSSYKDLDTRERMTTMWTDFVKYENPTAFESALINTKWLPYTNNNRNYMEINKKLQMKRNLFEDGYNFWNEVYEKYYWIPTPPKFEKSNENKEAGSLNDKNSSTVKSTPKDKNTKVTDTTVKKDTAKENNTLKDNNASKEKSAQKANDKNNTHKENDSSQENNTLKEQDTAKEKKAPIKKETAKLKATTKENDASKEKDSPKENNNPKEKDTINKAPIKKETIKEKEEAVKEKDNIKEKYDPKGKDNVKLKDTTKEKDASKKKDTPKESDTPKEQETPARKATMKEYETPKNKDAVKEKYVSKENDTPKEINTPKKEKIPEGKATTKENEASEAKNTPKEKHITKAKESTKDKDALKEKHTPMETKQK